MTIGWRVAFFIGVVPAVLVFFVRREDDDADIFKRAKARAQQQGRTFLPVAIFSPKLRRLTALACLLALGAQGAGFAVSNYLTTFLSQERGLSLSVAGIYVLFNSLGGFFGFLTNAYIGDRVGRRQAFRYFAVGFIIARECLHLRCRWAIRPSPCCRPGSSTASSSSASMPRSARTSPSCSRPRCGRRDSPSPTTSAAPRARCSSQGVAMLSAYMPLSSGMVIMASIAQSCAIIATLMLPETAGRELTDLASDDVTADDGHVVRSSCRLIQR